MRGRTDHNTAEARIIAYLNRHMGTRCNLENIMLGTGLNKCTTKRTLQELDFHDRIRKHPPKASGLTHWSIEPDTAPEKRPLRCLVFCGAIFTPPRTEKHRPNYHQRHTEHPERHEDGF